MLQVFRKLDRTVALTGIVSLAVALFIIGTTLGPETAIKGSYMLLAMVLATFLYNRNPSWDNSLTVGLSAPNITKLMVFVFLTSILLSFTIEQRWLILITTLPIGYYLVISGIHRSELPSPAWIFIQVSILFSIPLITELVQTGVYFGNGDLLKHSRFVTELVEQGTIEAIPSDYSSLPGLHLLIGQIHTVTNLPVILSISVTGIIVYAVSGIGLVFTLANRVLTKRLAFYSVVVGSAVVQMTYFSLYFFPQSLGVLLLITSLFAGTAGSIQQDRRLILLSVLTAIIVVFTHHLSLILFLPILLVLSICAHRSVLSARIVTPTALGFLAGLAYWSLLVDNFITNFVSFAMGTISGVTASNQGASSVFYYGVQPKSETLGDAALSLISVDGLYYIAIATLCIIGVLAVLGATSRGYSISPYLLLAIVSIPFILKTPLAIKSLTRLQLPLAFFLSMIVGLGIKNALNTRTRIKKAGALLTVLVLCVTGPLVAAEDFSDSNRPAQYQFTDSEYEQLNSVGTFAEHSRMSTTLWADRQGLYSLGYTSSGRVTLRRSGIEYPEGVFIYRTRWPEHRMSVTTSPVYSNKVVMSDMWLSDSIESSHKVFSSGQVGVIWSGNRTTLSP
ncbi:hypothetical protein [Halogeometricum borinquense]|uniref:Glycosyltransferase RgtA/B/C/D-like domain-containing protein n=1 Tax=Halogeometricum borinquense (strain ATCC 700274 / DSM 11551 / JCM 10706 / KCTC 4070 / PR3) TaxID=469382 RepID=E4NUG8_HALBP|nr:hypothetical protein [Halogeometricum borinquense]ADQ68688.1 hypothetical protein Hbor_31530 [Halogeometricum borinquense DSM 11551]